MQGIKQRVI
jgi:hypothetical protein